MKSKFISEINEDIECLKYYIKNDFSTGGSTVKLARIIRMMYIMTFIIIVLILILTNK